MFSFIDTVLNRITMYRLVLYYLAALLAAAFLFGIVGILPVDPIALIASTLVILAASWVANIVFAYAFDALRNVESVYITALILALILPPAAPADLTGLSVLAFAAAWAMASKYIFAFGRKHVFNPAAFGVALAALALGRPATWWVAGNIALLPFVLVGGLLIVRKLRRFDLFFAFGAAALATVYLTAAGSGTNAIVQTLLHSSFFFLAFAMLTEPLTMPHTRPLRVLYGILVGILFAPNLPLGSFSLTPELALLIGNIFAYLVSPKGRFTLSLIDRIKLADGTYEFSFLPDRPLSAFRPGQYAEWTLPHAQSDNRGNRRYFTIASSPKEDTVRLGVRFYEPASSFKQALGMLRRGDTVSISHLAGDFVLPNNRNKKLAFIAGGIGITPFRSMIGHLIDTRDTRDAVLLYSNKTAAEIAYKDFFDRAARTGVRTVYALTNEPQPVPGTYRGPIDAALIARAMPDYRERVFYISGPHGMVDAFEKTLATMGVPHRNIKTDFFPGFA